jgi:hypothetical protein
VNYPDGQFAVQFNGATLGFGVFDKNQTVPPGAIVDNKRRSAVLERERRSRLLIRRGGEPCCHAGRKNGQTAPQFWEPGNIG